MGANPESRTETQSLAERWQSELLEVSRYSSELTGQEGWVGGAEYAFYPFDQGVTEAFAIGVQEPHVVVYNTGSPLKEDQVTDIRDSYQWFYERVHASLFGEPTDVVIGNHLSPMFDESLGAVRRRLGFYDGEQSYPLLSLDNGLFQGGLGIEKSRFQKLLNMGFSLPSIVLTHEISHLVIGPHSRREEGFAAAAGWVINHFETTVDEKERSVTTYRLGDEALGEPPTPYAALDPSEDWADSAVFYRFAPEILDDFRFLGVARILREKIQDYGDEQPYMGVRMLRLPEPVYPNWNALE